MKGCLLFPGSLFAALALGVIAGSLAEAITGDRQTSSLFGMGVWIVSFLLLLTYGSLCIHTAEEIAPPPRSTSTVQRWRDAKADSKLATSELRLALIFALIGGGLASAANASRLTSTVVAAAFAVMGGLVGFDFKRRVRRIRERVATKPAAPPKD